MRRLLSKEIDIAQHQTYLISTLQPLTPQQWAYWMFSDDTRLAWNLILARLSYGKCHVLVTTKRTFNDTVSVMLDCLFGGELFWVPELICKFKLEP
ncbi:hypothetical protein TNCV_3614891 [Trichonephila clavipes]|nr:hypothetical protein TNCV_3614891 [Trichonephila clavipes]